jgi:hypothetical protein
MIKEELDKACQVHITAVAHGGQQTCNDWSGAMVWKKAKQGGRSNNGTIRPFIKMQVNVNI